jgi:hypothetical protein
MRPTLPAKINLADEPARWKCICGHDPCDGLDCGVYLPGQEPRRKIATPKSPEEIRAIRLRAWATRREKAARKARCKS